MTQNADKHSGGSRRRKWQEAALIVPLLGLFLLTPPFISIFSIKVSIFGIPLIVLYIFVVWISLILTTRFLAARLGRDDAERADRDAPERSEDDIRMNGIER